jgi:enamine deaminase RidA (YjgF/YER057c/UK114 family)
MSIARIGSTPTYSEAVVHGGVVYLSGQVPWHTSQSGITEQTEEVFQNIQKQLLAANSGLDRILSMQIFLVDPAEYELMNSVFKRWIPADSAPARNTICGVKFPKPGWRIEVVVVAAAN